MVVHLRLPFPNLSPRALNLTSLSCLPLSLTLGSLGFPDKNGYKLAQPLSCCLEDNTQALCGLLPVTRGKRQATPE